MSFGQEVEQSTVILTKARVSVAAGGTTKSARSFTLLNFNSSNKLEKEYSVDEHIYNDNGMKNDLKAGDGIYTSNDLFTNPKNTPVNYIMKSSSFKYDKELEQYLSANKMTVKIGCKIRHVRSGYTTVFGLDCSRVLGGCIEFYDCELSVEFSW